MSANLYVDRAGKVHLALAARAWHGAGTIIGAAFDLARGLVESGEDETIIAEPVYLASGARAPGQALTRPSAGEAMVVVGPGYTPVQAREMFAGLVRALGREEHEAVFESMGALGANGETIFASSILVESVKVRDTTLETRVTAISGHGTRGARYVESEILGVCANTVGAIERSGEVLGAIKHSRGAHARLTASADRIKARRAERATLAAALETAGGVTLGHDAAQEIVAHLYPNVDDAGKATASASKAQNRVLELWRGGEAAGLVGAEVWGRETALALHSANSQYLDREYAMRIGGMSASQAGASRYLRSNLGLDSNINRIRSEANRVLLGVGV
jgi:hypothetical protein